jgi:hypothetical protein
MYDPLLLVLLYPAPTLCLCFTLGYLVGARQGPRAEAAAAPSCWKDLKPRLSTQSKAQFVESTLTSNMAVITGLDGELYDVVGTNRTGTGLRGSTCASLTDTASVTRVVGRRQAIWIKKRGAVCAPHHRGAESK